jgi:hypothetical protein
MNKIMKLNYHNLKLIQESDEQFHFTHTTTLTTTTTTKSCCSSSVIDNQNLTCKKKTLRTVIMEDQMSNCSCSKKSLKSISEYDGITNGVISKNKDIVKNSNLSEISSIAE